MAISPLGPLAAVTTVMEYLRPDKSPYLLVIVSSIAGLMYVCSQEISSGRFFFVMMPIGIVLFFLTLFFLNS